LLAMDANDNAGNLNERVVQSFSRASSLLQVRICPVEASAPPQESIPMITDRLPSLALPSGAARAYLRGEWTASHLHFKRLRASVSAKQNGFWQIVH